MFARRLPIMLIAFLYALVPVTVLSGQDGVERGCISGAESASDRQGGKVGSLELKVIEQAAESTVTVACSSARIETISVLLPPRREAIIEFVLTNHAQVDAQFTVTGLVPGGDEAEWLTIDPQAGQAAAAVDVPIRLVLRPASLEPGSVHQLLVRFALDEGGDNFIVEVPVSLEIQGEDPMFRDRFEVDPVLGQFSYRAPESRHSNGQGNRQFNRGEFSPADRHIPIGTSQ